MRKSLKKLSSIIGMMSVIAIGSSSQTAIASNGLGFYAGGAAGPGYARDEETNSKAGIEFEGLRVAWKAALGVRPISWFGVEIEYIDFGTERVQKSYAVPGARITKDVKAGARAQSLLGVVYWSIPDTRADVYTKFGYANIQHYIRGMASTTLDSNSGCQTQTSSSCAPLLTDLRWSRSEKRPQLGVGVQMNRQHFAIRVEVERIRSSAGDSSIASLGAIWQF